jgi:hypothetical protein
MHHRWLINFNATTQHSRQRRGADSGRAHPHLAHESNQRMILQTNTGLGVYGAETFLIHRNGRKKFMRN